MTTEVDDVAPTRRLTLTESRSLLDVGLLVLRLGVGFELFAHGAQKFGLFGGSVGLSGKHVSGVAAINAQAGGLLTFAGFDHTVALSWLLTFTELGGGILLMVGFLTPLAASAVIGDMFTLIGLGWQAGWFGNAAVQTGYEFDVVIVAAAAAISLIGPGRYSADGALKWKLRGFPWGVAGIVLGLAVGLFVLQVFGPGFGGLDLTPPGK